MINCQMKENGAELSEVIVCSKAIYRPLWRDCGNELPDYEPKVSAIQIKEIIEYGN